MARLKPTDIPRAWLQSACSGYPVGRIVNTIKRGEAPIPEHLADEASKTTVARAKSLYGLFDPEERYKEESWLRALYQDNQAVDEDDAKISDVAAVAQDDPTVASISSETIIRWLAVYDIPTDQPRDEIPRTEELDRAYFARKYNDEQLTLNELRDEVNEKLGDDIEISMDTLVDHLDWLDIETRSPGGPKQDLTPIDNSDEYILNHHYRVREIEDAAEVEFDDSIHLRKRWIDEHDEVEHWVSEPLLPDVDLLYDPDGVADGSMPELADRYAQYRDQDNPIEELAADLNIVPAALELALVFYGIREKLTFVGIDDETVVEDVPRERDEILTSRGAFAVLRLTFGLGLTEIAEYLDVCEGLVKFADRVYDIPIETNVGRNSTGYRGQLHDPRYLRRHLKTMSVAELATHHNYESDTPVQRLLDAFELTPPTKIEVPELNCSVRSELEKHVGKLLAAIAEETPSIEVGYEVSQIELDISEFECEKEKKEYVPDFTVETRQQTFHIEVKGAIDNGIVYEHTVTDRQKAKAMMDALGDADTEQYVVITNGAELEWYDYEFSFAEGFEVGGSFNKYDQILANSDKLRSLVSQQRDSHIHR